LGRKLQDTFDYLKTSASRKPNYSPPSPSSFAAETTTLYPGFYKFITTSAPKRPTEFTGAPAWPYSGKGYIKTDENWTTYLENCWKYKNT